MLVGFGSYELDKDRRELRFREVPVHVEPQVLDLLIYLVANRNHVVSKDDMVKAVWGGRIVSDVTLNSRINAARRAVGDNGKTQALIRTVPRRGFRFVGEVSDNAAQPKLSVPLPGRPPTAERRQLTVLSCELTLGTEAAGMDPEDLRDVIGAYHRCVTETARRHNGLFGNALGKIALVHFGFPEAHEYDAEQAVRAGLELCAAVARIESRGQVRLQARVGIATGPVIVGDRSAVAETPDLHLVGGAANLAGQLQASAQRDTVVIDQTTRRLIAGLFECHDVGLTGAPGSIASVQAWEVLRAGSVEGRFAALHSAEMTPLVGRAEDIELLHRRWEQVKDGEERVVLISGEAGIGKSRIIAAFEERIQSEAYFRLHYSCSPHHADSALHPIIAQLERSASFDLRDTPERKFAKLDALLARATVPPEDVALLAEQLSLPAAERHLVDLGLGQRKERTAEPFVRYIAALARRNQVLIIFEDVHWIDPTSLDVLSLAIERLQSLPVLVLITFRPEFKAPWLGQPNVMMLTLNRLNLRERAALAQQAARSKVLPRHLLDEIVERTDGVPLFIEELTKAILEITETEQAKQATFHPLGMATIPATLQASLMARLDRLGPAKQVAEIGAAIGREFSYELLDVVAAWPEGALAKAIDSLLRAALVVSHGEGAHTVYTFKHALVRDAAYGSLLRDRRRQLHAEIATTIQERFPETVRDQPQLVAMHLLNAEKPKEALPHILSAARIFTHRYSYVEALRWFERGAKILQELPRDGENQRLELDLYVAWTPVLMAINGYTDQKTLAVAEHADALCRHFNVMDSLLPILFAQVSFYGAGGGTLKQGLEFAPRLLQLGEETGDHLALMIGHRFAGFCLLWMGRFDEAAAALLLALEHAPSTRVDGLAQRFGQDPETTALVLLGSVRRLAGSIEEGERLMQTALAKARELGHPLTLAYVLRHYTIFAALSKNYSVIETLSEELTNVCVRYEIRQWFQLGPLMKAWARFQTLRDINAISELRTLIQQHRDTGFRRNLPFYLVTVAEALLDSCQADQARELIDEAYSLMHEMNELWIEPQILEVAARARNPTT
jgi:DNA-binding winged helix-turn-helix (wHTH) protein/tetratricopeptide (TPR) repeat protein